MPTWKQLSGAAGHAVFRGRDLLAPLAVIVLVASTRRDDFLAPPSLDHWLDGLGVAAMIGGLAIRALVIATSAIRRSGVHKRVVVPTLFESGPYAWCRNPLYVANGVILIGLTLLFDSRWMVGIALPTALLAIRSIVAAEERVLLRSFGARYRDYCRRVPRFVPHPPFPVAPVGPLEWRRALKKEHGTAFAATTTALVLIAAEDVSRMPGTTWHRPAAASFGVWLVAAALWATVRHLKRRGRLTEGIDTSPSAIPHPAASVGDVAA
jgi:protein-S-isoprenylcysteine O-methyltransferase Ste14